MMYYDKNNIQIKNGDIIDIHQTVNGQNLFVILTVNPLDIRYHDDINRKYEYDMEDLLKPCRFTGETEYEIIDNVNNSNDELR